MIVNKYVEVDENGIYVIEECGDEYTRELVELEEITE